MNSHGKIVLRGAIIFLILLTGCNRGEKELLDDLLAVEEGAYRDSKISERTTDELLTAIKFMKSDLERTVETGVRLVVYYKLVAQKFMEQGLYGLASDFYTKALEIDPTNKVVAYRLGVCTAHVAKAAPDSEIKMAGFEKALAYHLLALELDPNFGDALYAICVLYIFELDAIGDAEVYLERLINVEPGNMGGMFLLARVYAHFGRIEEAVSLYDQIIRKSGNDEQVAQAKKNRAVLSGGMDAN